MSCIHDKLKEYAQCCVNDYFYFKSASFRHYGEVVWHNSFFLTMSIVWKSLKAGAIGNLYLCFHPHYFLWAFWTVALQKVDGSCKILNNFPDFAQNPPAWGGFWLLRKRVNTLKRRWKHICPTANFSSPIICSHLDLVSLSRKAWSTTKQNLLQEWFEEHNESEVMIRPPNSSNLNPINHLWDVLNIQDHECWCRIAKHTFRCLLESIYHRV